MRIILVLTLCFCGMLNTAHAQKKDQRPCTLTFLNGKTARGEMYVTIKNATMQQVTFFSGTGKSEAYDVRQLAAFEYERKDGKTERFVRRVVDVDHSPHELGDLETAPNPTFRRDTVFMQVLVEGAYVSLYEMIDSKRKIHFFVERDSIRELIYKEYYDQKNVTGPFPLSNHTVISKNNIFRRQLAQLAESTCKTVFDKVGTLIYKREVLMPIAGELNTCHGQPVSYTWKKERTSFEFGLLAGGSVTTHKTEKLAYVDSDGGSQFDRVPFQSVPQVNIGVFVHTALPRTNERVAFYGEFLLKGIRAERSFSTLFNDQQQEFRMLQLRFSPTLRTYFPLGKTRLFIQGGPALCAIVSNQSSKRITERFRSLTTSSALFNAQKYNIGFTGSLGIRYKRYTLQARYDRDEFLEAPLSKFSYNNGYSLLLGFAI
jgi:hypothetical protein